MAYITLPQTERTKSGFEAFTEGASPYLQMAMQAMLQRKAEEQRRQKNIDLARQTNPELFTEQLTPEGIQYARQMGLQRGTKEPGGAISIPTEQLKTNGSYSVPDKFKKFVFNKEKIGAPSINVATGEVSYKPEDAFNAYYRSLIPKTGEVRPQGDLIYRNSEGVEIPAEQAQVDIEKGNTNFYISKREVTKSGIKENVISKPEDLEKSRAIKDKSDFVLSQAQDALDTISEVEQGIQHFGLWGQLPSIPGTARVNWEANVNKLLSGKVIDVMTKMKEASKTGATGFGQLSEKELAVLQQASTALKRGLSPEDAQRYLGAMKTSLQKVVEGGQQQEAMPQNNVDPMEGKTAVNPKTGQKIIKRGGQWLPMQ